MTSPTPLNYVYLRTSAEAPTELRPLEGDPEDFVVSNWYDVVSLAYDAQAMDVVGQVLGNIGVERVLLGAALNESVSWDDVMTTMSDGLRDIFHIMFDPQTEDLCEQFEYAVGGASFNGHDLLYIPTDEMLDEVWGPHMLRTLMQHHTDCRYAIVRVSGLYDAESDAEYQDALSRCAKLQALGYVQYPESSFFFFDLSRHLPELPEHLTLDAAAEAQPA